MTSVTVVIYDLVMSLLLIYVIDLLYSTRTDGNHETRTYTRTDSHTYTHTHTDSHTYTHTHTH